VAEDKNKPADAESPAADRASTPSDRASPPSDWASTPSDGTSLTADGDLDQTDDSAAESRGFPGETPESQDPSALDDPPGTDGPTAAADPPCLSRPQADSGDLLEVAQQPRVPGLTAMLDVPLEVSVEVGRVSLPLGDVLGLQPGSVVELERVPGEPLDLLVNGRPVAKGEIVVINDTFGFRVTDVFGQSCPAPGTEEETEDATC